MNEHSKLDKIAYHFALKLISIGGIRWHDHIGHGERYSYEECRSCGAYSDRSPSIKEIIHRKNCAYLEAKNFIVQRSKNYIEEEMKNHNEFSEKYSALLVELNQLKTSSINFRKTLATWLQGSFFPEGIRPHEWLHDKIKNDLALLSGIFHEIEERLTDVGRDAVNDGNNDDDNDDESE